MKNFILLIMFFSINAVAFGALSVEGTYQGKNLYVQNPMDDEGFGYCATKVTVNGDIMPGGTSMGAFEIDFSLFNIAIGEPVFIVIEHNDGCKPKILNPEVLLPRSTYNVESMSISDDGKLTWKTSGEQGKLPFIIEQYRWNKWVTIGEVQGKGSGASNSYEFTVTPHSGENTIRIAQIDHSGTKRPSKEVKFESSAPVVTKTPTKVKNEIKFIANGKPAETRYEIYDAYGNIVKKGVGSSVNCSNLLRGVYYINFDNVNEKFIKN
ncbi:MAG: T9SS type A sorting domain-containing protein [Fluviicola sp.]|nr:T9SS type A sorting domain-containing protein [Fluviicola sp.]